MLVAATAAVEEKPKVRPAQTDTKAQVESSGSTPPEAFHPDFWTRMTAEIYKSTSQAVAEVLENKIVVIVGPMTARVAELEATVTDLQQSLAQISTNISNPSDLIQDMRFK